MLCYLPRPFSPRFSMTRPRYWHSYPPPSATAPADDASMQLFVALMRHPRPPRRRSQTCLTRLATCRPPPCRTSCPTRRETCRPPPRVTQIDAWLDCWQKKGMIEEMDWCTDADHKHRKIYLLEFGLRPRRKITLIQFHHRGSLHRHSLFFFPMRICNK